MTQSIPTSLANEELARFFVVAQSFRQHGDEQAFMPACPVDTEWHRLLKSPGEYRRFCDAVLGHSVRHDLAQGEGKINWAETYRQLYGHLPEIWFQDTAGVVDVMRQRTYREMGVFYASWDCTPG